MNGIGLLVLIAAFGQVDLSQHAGKERDYGWELDPRDGALCYIVQVSPEDAQKMQTGKLENPSDMPPELVGRATRIIFRIGSDVLPRTPSLAEIKKIPPFNSASDVTAALGPGRSAAVEPDAVMNVQGGELPRLPAGSNLPQSSGLTTQPPQAADLLSALGQRAGNAIDQARAASGIPPLPGGTPAVNSPVSPADQFRLGTSGGRPADTSTNTAGGNVPSTTPSFPNAYPNTGPSKFENATNEASGDARQPSGWQPPTNGQVGNAQTGNGQAAPRDDMTRVADNRPAYDQTNGNYNPNPTNAYGQGGYGSNGLGQNGLGQNGYGQGAYGPNGYGQGGYDPRNPPSLGGLGLPNQQTPVGGFGSFNGGYGGGMGANPGFPGGYTGAPQSPSGPPYNYNPGPAADGIDRLASNSTTGGTSTPTKPPAASNNDASSASDGAAARRSKSSDGILQGFFVLSLVVNFYLGGLIRKLLSRYRALLASVRGQTA